MASLQASHVFHKLHEIIQTTKEATDAVISDFGGRLEGLQHGPKEFKIGIFGPSGHGKTSLIEALVNEPGLLHINCHRASTSVINKILWNNKQDSQYRSEILFLSEIEWSQQLNQWLEDLALVADDTNPSSRRKEEPAEIAFASLKTVYPYITKENVGSFGLEALMQDQFVKDVLGRTLELECRTATELRNQTKTYIDAKDKQKYRATGTNPAPSTSDAAYWPLIREVHTFLRSPALQTGCALVDLPGIRDSNAARDVLAEGYIQQCDEVWIVADINRAEDDSVADLLTGLLGDKLKRQLYLDGNLHHVRFICTKTDIISVETARVNFEDDPSFTVTIDDVDENRTAFSRRLGVVRTRVREIGAQLEALERRKRSICGKRKGEDLVDEPGKRPRLNSMRTLMIGAAFENTDVSQQDLNLLGSEVSSTNGIHSVRGFEETAERLMAEKCNLLDETTFIEERLAELEQQEWLTCVQKRNTISSLDIQEAFLNTLRDLSRSASADNNRNTPHLENKKIPIHCVSSEGFRKIDRPSSSCKCFRNIADTGIPSLVEHVRKTGRKSAKHRWTGYTNEVDKTLTSLWLYLQRDEMETGSGRSDNVMSTERLNKFVQEMTVTMTELIDWIRGSVSTNLRCQLPGAALVGQSHATQVLQDWQADIRWNTLKAIMQRGGVWSNSKCSYDLNTELANIFLEDLAQWPTTFTETIPTHVTLALQTCNRLSKDFNDSLARDEKLHGLDSVKIMTLKGQVTRLCGSLTLSCNETKSNIEREQRAINRLPQRIVHAALEPAYVECAAFFGKGVQERMKLRMLEGLQGSKNDMYQQMKSEVDSALSRTIDQEENILMNRTRTSCDLLIQDYKILFVHDTQGKPAVIDNKTDQDLIKLLNEFGALLHLHRVEAQEIEVDEAASTAAVDTTDMQRASRQVTSDMQSTSTENVVIKIDRDSDEKSEHPDL